MNGIHYSIVVTNEYDSIDVFICQESAHLVHFETLNAFLYLAFMCVHALRYISLFKSGFEGIIPGASLADIE